MTRTVFENNARVAHAVYTVSQRWENLHLTLRPFNRFDPAFTDWWLVPSSEWPAHKYGKLCFHRRGGMLYVGYYIEKGLGKRLRGMPDVAAKHIMQEDWQWYDFVAWTDNGRIQEIMAQVIEQSGVPVRVRVEAYAFNHVPEPDGKTDGPDDMMEFEVENPAGRLRPVSEARDALRTLSDVSDIRQMATRVNADRNLDFFWVTLTLGIRLQYGDGSAEGWDAHALWSRALAPWVRLLL